MTQVAIGSDAGSMWICGCPAVKHRNEIFCNGCNTGAPPCPHKIEGRQVTAEDLGANVTYIPGHADGKASHPDCERGVIKSWSPTAIFVTYGRSTQATTPSDLIWG